MINYNTTNSNLKRGILNYSKKISKGLKRPEMKFVGDMTYGILASKSCHISKIARNLNEDIRLIKTENRLCRNLNDLSEEECLIIQENYLRTIKSKYDDKSVIVIDGSDITKPASKALESLCMVRDGSTGEIKPGYATMDAAVLSSESKSPIGVYSRIYSTTEKGFVSENKEIFDCFRYLSKHFGKDNVRTMDRGFDCNEFYGYFIENKERFVIRAKMNRNVIYNGKSENILKTVGRFKGKYRLDYVDKEGKPGSVKISVIPIRLPEFKNVPLNLVAVYGLGDTPMMLITNMDADDKRICVTVCKVYILRWRIEEYFEFKKQSFGFEDLRVRSLRSIRNLNFLITIAIGYIALMSDKSDNSILRLEIIEVSQRMFGVPKFLYYALSDGIFEILKFVKSGIKSFFAPEPYDPQLVFKV